MLYNDNESDSMDETIVGTPPEIAEIAKIATLDLLPEKSKARYKKERDNFLAWCEEKNAKNITENVLLAYFSEKSKLFKSSTLWSMYSMLRSTLVLEDNVDISKYHKLMAFLKRKSVGYVAKKSRTFCKDDIDKFIGEAPDKDYLMLKVIFSNF